MSGSTPRSARRRVETELNGSERRLRDAVSVNACICAVRSSLVNAGGRIDVAAQRLRQPVPQDRVGQLTALSRRCGKLSARSRSMCGACDPWPGNRNASSASFCTMPHVDACRVVQRDARTATASMAGRSFAARSARSQATIATRTARASGRVLSPARPSRQASASAGAAPASRACNALRRRRRHIR